VAQEIHTGQKPQGEVRC